MEACDGMNVPATSICQRWALLACPCR
jgi:hypothetical protein